MQSDIFNKNPDNSPNVKGIQGYKNSSNVFNYTQPNQIAKGIRDYHLQSDILFQKILQKKIKLIIEEFIKIRNRKLNQKKKKIIKKM